MSSSKFEITMQNSNQIMRFLFDESDIRGEITILDSAFQESISAQNIDPLLRPLCGEFFAAAALLSDILKFDGTLTLQARGDGPVSILMAEANDQGHLRGVVNVNDADQLVNTDTGKLKPISQLLGSGVLSLTLDPRQGQRYQGIVPLERSTLAECIEHYFEQSEQLPTLIRLFESDGRCGGIFLQSLPAQIVSDPEIRSDQWQTASQLAATLKPQEFFDTDQETLLFRLFHELNCRVFEPKSLCYRCNCSRERCADSLASLGEKELQSIIAEQGRIQMHCQFCGTEYEFKEGDIASVLDTKPTLH
jgi:molecular chaperone Hsp33